MIIPTPICIKNLRESKIVKILDTPFIGCCRKDIKNNDKNEEVLWTKEGCTVKDGKIYQDYDILMHKVDVGFGS